MLPDHRYQLHRYPYDHWEPYLRDAPDRIAADQIDFLQRCGLLVG
ncbi:MAG TPA: hypothetical protein VK848_08285 [Acidimicrobiia bacterium]|nr:hypothetical protein [Acidimicrobiia bacterium]